MPRRPSGTVTFLFTDVEGSTRLWESDRKAMEVALAEHDRLIQAAADEGSGYVFSTAGDAFAIAFQEPTEAVAAAIRCQAGLQSARFDGIGRLRVRMAIHSGEAEERDGNYYGPTLNRCARILSIASGDEVLVSSATQQRLNGGLPSGASLTDIGEFRLKDLGLSNRVYRLTHKELVRVEETRDMRRIRGYDVDEKIGEGGFGVVYRARQSGVEREVAVKAVRPDFANNPEFIRRFDTEAQLVARLEHPFIVPLYDYWREPSGAFLVMRWLKGGSLEAALRRGPWNLDATLKLLRQIGDALATAHRHDVVHRDLKPANILLDEDGNAYLSDFGIAADVAAAIQLDALDQSTDWPAYASPELLRREAATPASDIYSLGLVLFETLTGEYPFGHALPSELIKKQLEQDPGRVDALRSEIPSSVADVVRRATSRDASQRYRTVEQLVSEFEVAVAAEPVTVTGSAGAARNPYKGLAAFQQIDAGDFFGREALRDQIVAELATRRLVAVVGPSGSGKSSVVKAGVVPALQRGGIEGSGRWFFTEMVPAASPFEELEAALLRVAIDPSTPIIEQLRSDAGGLARVVEEVLPEGDGQLVLVIDQFEEVFTLVPESGTRRRFLRSLLSAVGSDESRLRVVLTLRADFFDQPLLHPDFAEALKAGLVTVTPLTGEELERAIVEPGRRVGVSFEPGLVGDIVSDVVDQVGALPLLQYALTQLFDRRVEAVLTRDGYRSLGGVAGALGMRAEDVFVGIDEPERDVARQVFLRLVTLGEGTGDTRRRVLRDELDALSADPTTVALVLDTFGHQRLIAFDRDPATRRPTVEVAHEALLREWTRLREWIDSGRSDVRMQRRLSQSASEWEEAGHDASFLLTGARLGQAESWMEGSDVALTDVESDYMAASLDRRRAEEADERARAERERALERRSVLRLRVLVGVLAAGVLVAAGLSWFAFDQRGEAQAQARQARAQSLATASVADLDTDPELSLLLALEGARISREAGEEVLPEIVDALHRSLTSVRSIFSAIDTTAGDIAPDGSEIVLGRGSDAVVFDPITGVVIRTLTGHDGAVRQATFSPDGEHIATASADGSVRIWDAESGLFLRRMGDHPGGASGLSYSPSGERLASFGVDQAVRIWDTDTGDSTASFQSLSGVNGIAWTPDSEMLALSAGGVIVIDASDGARITELGGLEGAAGLAFSPDGGTLAVGRFEGIVELWDFDPEATSEQPAEVLTGHSDFVFGLTYAEDGEILLSAGDDGQVLVSDLETGEVLSMPGHTAGVRWIRLSPDGRSVLTTSRDGVTRLSDISPAGSHEWHTIEIDQPAFGIQLSPDGTMLGAANGQDLHLWDVTDPGSAEPLPIAESVTSARLQGIWLDSDWNRIFGVTTGAAVAVWDRDTGSRIADLGVNLLGFVATSRDGEMVAVQVGSTEIQIWDVATAELIRSWPADLGDIGDETAFMELNADSSLLAVGTPTGLIRVWNVADGTVLFEDRIEGAPAARELRFSSDGTWLAASASDAMIRFWDLPSGERQDRVLVHSGDPIRLHLARGDELLVSGSTDGSVRVWELSDPDAPLTLAAHENPVIGLAAHPSGDRLYTAGGDSTIRTWALDIDDLVSLGGARVSRTLDPGECLRYSFDPDCG